MQEQFKEQMLQNASVRPVSNPPASNYYSNAFQGKKLVPLFPICVK